MKSEDESIKMLEMRMQQQLSLSREKNITSQNIQYYISSATLHTEKPRPDVSPVQNVIPDPAVSEKPQDGQIPTAQESEDPRQKNSTPHQEAASIEKEHEDYLQKLRNSGLKEVVQKMEIPEAAEIQHIRGKNEYEKVLRSINTEAFSDFEISLFNGKI